MSFKHLVLGFLLDHPTHGYDMMKKMFEDFSPVSPDVNEGKLYSTLKKMENDHLIEKVVRRQDGPPYQKIAHVTSRGEKEFYDWLYSEENEKDSVRFDFFIQYPFLLKVNHFRLLTPDQIRTKLNNQLRICQERIARFQDAKDDMEKRGVDYYRVKIVDYGIEVERLRIRWLQDLLDDLDKKV